MLILPPKQIPGLDITDQSVWQSRRKFIQQASLLGIVGHQTISQAAYGNTEIPHIKNTAFSTTESLTGYSDLTSYIIFMNLARVKETLQSGQKTLLRAIGAFV